MGLILSACKETTAEESRVALTPETVKKITDMGISVVVEKGLGESASYTDDAYKASGATLAKSAADAVKKADIVLCVAPLNDKIIGSLKSEAIVIGGLDPFHFEASSKAYNKSKVHTLAMEFMPRITRAQSMDILSSQSNLAGYRSIIEASASFDRAFPMMMTAAGTVSPARAFVMGAGVAGLQAIATAKRLGAVVSATDVRPAAKEQVESLGAKFVMVESEEAENAETSGGYAKEMSAKFKKEQAELIAKTISQQDIVVCTALIPGKPAPILVSEDMVKSMKPGSVIVDLATAQGGNCTLSEKDKVVTKHGVHIIGYSNMASRVAHDASALFARNLLTFLKTFWDEEKKALTLAEDDEIIAAVTMTRGGKSVHSLLEKKPAAKAKPAAQKATKAKAKTATKAKPKTTKTKKAS